MCDNSTYIEISAYNGLGTNPFELFIADWLLSKYPNSVIPFTT